jgi:hypothetical protein
MGLILDDSIIALVCSIRDSIEEVILKVTESGERMIREQNNPAINKTFQIASQDASKCT